MSTCPKDLVVLQPRNGEDIDTEARNWWIILRFKYTTWKWVGTFRNIHTNRLGNY